ncbi:hypothetical protein CEXT_569471 [Caerostris extrusa]|uniref:Uncharacterized protein n=1 Tax=Caerostris extrusa TaxID=172846 RepID=A0AAV4X1Z6_CAEEX|nr:hypothetical protein CEXT_569471 [Caerostris extrusa]
MILNEHSREMEVPTFLLLLLRGHFDSQSVSETSSLPKDCSGRSCGRRIDNVKRDNVDSSIQQGQLIVKS